MLMLLSLGQCHSISLYWITIAMDSHLFAPCMLQVNATLGLTSTLFVNPVMFLRPSSLPCVTLSSYQLTEAMVSLMIGRYKSVLFSRFFEFVGLALLTEQAHYPSLKPPLCNMSSIIAAQCEKPSSGNEAFLFIFLYLLAFGSAGVKAALPSHGADQFDETDPKEARQMSTFFNTLLLAVCMGGAVSLMFIVWIQINKGWDWGFGIDTIAIFGGVLIFATGLPVYRTRVAQGTSSLIEIIQVYVAAICSKNLPFPEDPAELYEVEQDKEADVELELLPHTNNFRFLDRAAIYQPSSFSLYLYLFI